MSYLSASENIGFNVIPQNISEASCATQYKMAVDNVAGVCASEASPYVSNGTSPNQTYVLPHINDNFFQSKFKIDPNELYTFNDSDIIAGEVTVANSEDTVIDVVDFKPKVDSPKKEKVKTKNFVTNGVIKKPKKEVANGHCKPASKPVPVKNVAVPTKTNSKSQPKVPKPKTQTGKETKQSKATAKGPLVNPTNVSTSTGNIVKTSIIREHNSTPPPDAKTGKTSSAVTFLDVFMREQGLDDVKVKLEPPDSPPPLAPLAPPLLPPPSKDPSQTLAQKKTPTTSYPTAATVVKTATPKSRRGRGPTHHEALQRISRRAVAAPVRPWHAPGHELFDLRPLSETPPNRYRRLETSSDEDEYMPNFAAHLGCVEESAVENREQRIALRQAALRRQLALAKKSMRHASDFRRQRALAASLKKHMEQEQSSRVPQYLVSDILMKRGMTSVLTLEDKKLLRTQGWSGGETVPRATCAHDPCDEGALPCAAHCARHVACSPAVRLFAGCSAVFAGGARCRELLVPLQEGAPLCAQHRAKRDNYDRISRESKPKKVIRKKMEVESKKANRRRRPPPPPPPPRPNGACATSLENHRVVTAVVNGATATLPTPCVPEGALGADHFIVSDDCDVQELEVEHVASDDMLVDPSVLSQIPDEAFTEFFNQAEGGAAFEESSELTRALEAVLDERALDALADRCHQLAPCPAALPSPAPS